MLSLLLPRAFSCCLLEMEVSSQVPSDALLPSLLDPFDFSVCKFTFLTSVNLQFGPHPPEPFASCRERSNVWFSNL